jgi:hypothetical protein
MGGRIEVDSEYGKGCSKSCLATLTRSRELKPWIFQAFRFFVRVLASERGKAIQAATSQAVTPPVLSPEHMPTKRKESVQGARRQDGSPCRVLVVEGE